MVASGDTTRDRARAPVKMPVTCYGGRRCSKGADTLSDAVLPVALLDIPSSIHYIRLSWYTRTHFMCCRVSPKPAGRSYASPTRCELEPAGVPESVGADGGGGDHRRTTLPRRH